MNLLNDGKPYHGSEAVSDGKLNGTTDTDYFYFLCPKCGETQILQILDFVVTKDGPVQKYKEHRSKGRRDFQIDFEIWCPHCNLHDFVKLSNTGWAGGKLKDTIGVPTV